MDMNVVKDINGAEKLLPMDTKKYFCARDLFRGSKEIIILHGKEQYRLRVTRQNKLILTK